PRLALVALGTIRGNASVVAPDPPAGVLIDLVDHLIGGGKMTRGPQGIVHYPAGEITKLGFFGEANYLQVLKSVIGETRLPYFLSLFRENIFIVHLGRAYRIEVKTAIRIEAFRKAQGYRIAFFALYPEFYPANHI